MCDQDSQCLLFLTQTEADNSGSAIVCRQFNFEAYALIPHNLNLALFSRSKVKTAFAACGVEVIDCNKEYPSLFSTVKHSNVEVCELLLLGGVFQPSERLHVAICCSGSPNRLIEIRQLLRCDQIVVQNLGTVNSTHAQTAIDEQNLKFFDVLFSHGTNIRYGSPSGGTLLHFAVQYNLESLVKLLLKYGASVNAVNKDGATPLHSAASGGHIQITEELVKSGANVNATTTSDSKSEGFTPLRAAVFRKHLGVVNCLLENSFRNDAKCDVNKTSNKEAFLHAIVESYTCSEYKGIAEKMFTFGFSIDPEHKSDINMLKGAVRANLVEIMKKLLTEGADVNCHTQYRGERSLLHLAARWAREDMLTLLLENGASVDSLDYRQRTPIFDAVEGGCVKNLEVLKKFGASICCTDIDRLSPLHVASGAKCVKRGKASIVEFLLQHGANINAKCNERKTPLHFAIQRGSQSIVEVLLKFGAHFDFKSESVLFIISSSSNEKIFVTLLEYYLFNPQLFSDFWERFTSFVPPPRIRQRIWHQYVRCKSALQLHGYKITPITLHLYEGTKLGLFKNPIPEKIPDLKSQCVAEINSLKSEKIGNTNVSFHDMIMGDADQIVGYLRNSSIRDTFASGDYRVEFPLYGCILRAKFLKGNLRKALLRQGIKACHFLFHHFNVLPYDLKERILMYLSNEEIRILLSVCKLTYINFNEVESTITPKLSTIPMC